MLKEPYTLIHTEGNVRYYYLKFEDNPVTYIAAETIEPVIAVKKRWLRKPHVKNDEVTLSLKMVPLNSMLAFLMASAYFDDPKAIDDEGNVYSKWNAFDISDMADVFKEYLMQSGDNTTYDFPHIFKNPVVKGFSKDIRDVIPYAIENHGRFSRTMWLASRDSRGTLTTVSVEDIGKRTHSITNTVTIFLFSRDLMKIILEDMEKGLFTQEDSTPVFVEDGEPEGVEFEVDKNEMVN